MSNSTKAHVDANVTVGSGSAGVAVSASDTTSIFGLAGTVGVGGTAGVGAGVDVEVVTKDTEAWIAKPSDVTVTGNVTWTRHRARTCSRSQPARASAAGCRHRERGRSVFDITTKAFLADGTSSSDRVKVTADGSVRVAAEEGLKLDVIAGNLSGGGTAAVGAAVGVPVVTKNTHAYIGAYAEVNAKGNGTALTVKSGEFTVSTVDTRFDGANVSANTIDLGYNHGFEEDQEVVYDNGGGTSIGGLLDNDPNNDADPIKPGKQTALYYVHVVDAQHVQLRSTPGGSIIPISPGVGENQRLVPTNQAGVRKDESPRFNPQKSGAVNTGTDTITLPYAHGLTDDDAVIYSSGGGAPIGGLADGAKYYAKVISPTQIQLLDKKSTDGGVVKNLTSTGSGKSHSIVPDGNSPAGDASAFGPARHRERRDGRLPRRRRHRHEHRRRRLRSASAPASQEPRPSTSPARSACTRSPRRRTSARWRR
jgi:hypothetical protein